MSRTCRDSRIRKIFEIFSEKSGFLLSVFQKNANIRLGKIVLHGKLAGRDFFSGKDVFLLSTCRKKLNKGSDGLQRVHRVLRSCRDGRIRKIFEIFPENRGQNTTCLAITPIEGHLVVGPGKRLFFKKKPKNLDQFQKNSEYTGWKGFSENAEKS